MAYRYGGTDFDAAKPLPPDPRYDASLCGTYRGYRRHLRHHTKTCDPCKEARQQHVPKPQRTS